MKKKKLKFNYKIKWHHKLLLFALLVTIIPPLFFGLTLLNKMEEELTQSVNSNLTNIANGVASEINFFFVSGLEKVYLLKKSIESKELGANEKVALIISSVSGVDEVLSMSLFFNENGNYTSAIQIHKEEIDSLLSENNNEINDLFNNQTKNVKELVAQNALFGNPIFLESINKWCIFSVLEVSIEDAPEAYLVTILDLSLLQNKLEKPKYYEVGKVVVMNEEGETIFNNSDSLITKGIVDDALTLLKGEHRITEISNFSANNEKFVVSTAFPENINWVVIAVQDYKHAYALVAEMRYTIYFWLFVGMVLIFAVVLMITQRIKKPIIHLANKAKEISNGNFDISIDYNIDDSIGELSNSMLNMSSSLKKSFIKIEKQNKELEEYSRTLEDKVLDRTKELKETNDDLQKAYLKVLELNNEKNEFLGIAAHDLKNPLGAIKGFGNIILEDKNLEREDLEEFAGIIVESSERMFDIITSLLDINKIEEGRIEAKYEEVDANEILNSVVRQNYDLAEKKGIVIDYKPYKEEVLFSTDRNLVMQILDNFLSNAIKFSPFNEKIWVKLFVEDKSILFSVKDNGPGLSEDDKTKLFKKFTKLSARPTGGENSTGLGLSIAKKIAEMLGGDIVVISEKGKGAEFKIILPKS